MYVCDPDPGDALSRFMGIPATGNRSDIPTIDIIQFRGDPSVEVVALIAW